MCRLRPVTLIVAWIIILICSYLHWEMSLLNAKHVYNQHTHGDANGWKNSLEFQQVHTYSHHNSNVLHTLEEKCTRTSKSAREHEGTKLERRLPKCLIIGFAKCGTYALKSFLTVHPDIVSPNREISFFTKYYHKGLAWYRSQMPQSLESQITIEKTPSYILSREALFRIRAFNASIKLIISVRDPVIRLQSSFAHALASGKLINETFESWLSNMNTIARVADYETYIRHVYRLFPRRQVLIVQEENLESKPLDIMRVLEVFLGLCHAHTSDLLVFNSDKGFYCFNQSSPGYRDLQETLTLDHNNGCFSQSKGRTHAKIEPQLLKQLITQVTPYNQRLFALLGQRFNWTDLRSIQI